MTEQDQYHRCVIGDVQIVNLNNSGQSSSTCERVLEVYPWSSQVASEERDLSWINRRYAWPDVVRRIQNLLGNMRCGIIGFIGRQRVDRSSALQASYVSRIRAQEKPVRQAGY